MEHHLKVLSHQQLQLEHHLIVISAAAEGTSPNSAQSSAAGTSPNSAQSSAAADGTSPNSDISSCRWNITWSYVHTCAERLRADFDIPAALPRVCSHIRGADAGGSAISWGQWWFGARGFEAGAVNWMLDPFLAERFLLPLRLCSATVHVRTHVMICVEANFPPAPARACVNVP